MSDNVEIKIGASIDDLKAKLADAIGALRSFGTGAQTELSQRAGNAFGEFGQRAAQTFEAIKSKADEIPATMRTVGYAVAGALAVIGAGMAAKKFADDNAAMVEATRDFARALGTTTNEASVMQAALDDVGASQGEYTAAAKGLSKQLRTNEDDLKRLGLVTRDAAGNYRPLNDLMLDAIGIVNDHKAGTDRSIAAQIAFGRAVDGSSRVLLVNRDVYKENKKAVEELNLMIGGSSVEAWTDYDNASDRASLTVKAFGKAIAESVLPFVTELTEWFNGMMPAAMTVTRGALGGLTTAFVLLTYTVRAAWETINAMVISVAEPLVAVAGAISAIVSGKGMEAAAAPLRNIPKTVADAWTTAFDKIDQSHSKTMARIGNVWAWATGGNQTPGANGSPEGTKTAPNTKPKGDASENRMLAAQLAMQQASYEAQRAIQLEFLKQMESQLDRAHETGMVSEQDYHDEKIAIQARAFDVTLSALAMQLAELQAAEATARKNAADMNRPAQERGKWEAEALKYQAKSVQLVGQIGVLELQRVDAVRKVGNAYEDATRKVNEQLAAITLASAKQGGDASIAAERAKLDQMKALRQISAEDAFELERQIEERSYAAAQADIAARRALVDGSQADARVKLAQLHAESEQLSREHEQRKTEIESAAIRERKQLNVDAQRSTQGAFASMIQSLLQGTKTIGDALRSFGQQIAQVFTNLIAQRFTERLFERAGVNKAIDAIVNVVLGGLESMVMAWGAAEGTKTAATAAGATARTTIETTASATSKSLTISDALLTIGARAAAAAASVYAAIASIPVVGPFLAPVAAATAFAAVGKFAKNIFSAEGGWDAVPYDGAKAVLHHQEMVLPRFLAQGVRQMAEPGQLQAVVAAAMQSMQPQQPALAVHLAVSNNMIDGRAGDEFLHRQAKTLVKVLEKEYRNFGFKRD